MLRQTVVLCSAALFLLAEPTEPTRGEWGDQGNGTYANPVMPGDFSDLDAIRVGNDYYAISSTFQYSPGIVVLHSKDLVNWRIIGHVIDDVTRIGPDLNWDKMNRPGRGVWAGSIRHHAGKFWVYFATPDEGFFMSTATNPAGPWKPLKEMWRVSGWNDTCPFWDDDGQGYLVTTNFARDPATGKNYNIHLFKLSANGEEIIRESDRIIHQSRGSEANKLYKWNGVYYHYFSEVKPEGRVPMMNRSRKINGPWETKQLGHVNIKVDKEPNQGGFIQVPSGEWYFVSHQGTGDWEGRAGVLLPVTWIDGWPLIGRVGEDGIGNMVWRGRKPIAKGPLTTLWASDDFKANTLKPEWEWNYQPRAAKWSLSERRDALRLHAFRPLRSGDFFSIGNVLTQRSMRTKGSEVTVKLDLAGLADGQEAGLAHYAKTFCTLGVLQAGTTRSLSLNRNGQRTGGPPVTGSSIWLRTAWGFDGQSQFSYSLDGARFEEFGEKYPLSWGSYRGDRIGLFTVNESGERGYADFDTFTYDVAR